tara:strand:- start:1922 stop:3634 length:1713 start_codon:yes stop_codon:yes gene_type:complete
MIRFGMTIKEIAEQLVKGFFKVKGRMPTPLEKMKLEKETLDRYMEMRKVLDMQGNPIDPSKSIMGGTQEGAALKSGIMKTMGARPKQVLSEDEIRQKLMDQNKKGLESMKSKLDDPEDFATGGRAGFKLGAGKKGVQALIDLIQNKFGKGAATTADKAPIPPKTLERDMFKTADNRINKKEGVFMEDGKTPDYDYYKEILDDAEDSMGFNVAGDETIEELLKREKTLKDYEADMYDQYKTGKLDPEPGSKSQARLNLLKKRKEEAELTDDYRLFNSDDADELDELEEFLDQDYKRVKAEQADLEYEKNLKGLEDLGAPKLAERFKLKQKYPGISDDLLDKILIDDNVQRKAEVLATMDEAIKMMQKGKSNDEIIDTMKNVTRTKQADGGRIGLKAGMTKRAFLKLMGGVGAGIAGAKTGLMSLAKKSEPVVEAVKETAQEVPSYFFSLVNKIKLLGDDTLATQDKAVAKKYKDYIMEEDFAGNIEIIKKGGDDMYPEDVFMSYKVDDVPIKGGSKKVEEYEEFTARPDMDGKMKDVEEGVPDSVIEEAMKETPSIKIKKASGGIARMLGE